MFSTIIIGALFFGLIGWGIYKSIKSMGNNSCPGCAGGCSAEAKKQCHGNGGN